MSAALLLTKPAAHASAHSCAVWRALESGDKDAASEALRAAQPEMMRGVTKGIYHKNTIARKMSRLTARLKAIA